MIALALLLATASVSTGQRETFATCDRPERATADQIAACMGRLQAAADAELNRTYRAAIATLAPADRIALRDAQRAWLAFRAKDRASLTGPWRAGRSTRVRIEAARADITAIVARERQLHVYLVGPAPVR